MKSPAKKITKQSDRRYTWQLARPRSRHNLIAEKQDYQDQTAIAGKRPTFLLPFPLAIDMMLASIQFAPPQEA